MKKKFLQFQDIFNMQMNKEEEIPCLSLSGYHLVDLVHAKMSFSQVGLTSHTSLRLFQIIKPTTP